MLPKLEGLQHPHFWSQEVLATLLKVRGAFQVLYTQPSQCRSSKLLDASSLEGTGLPESVAGDLESARVEYETQAVPFMDKHKDLFDKSGTVPQERQRLGWSDPLLHRDIVHIVDPVRMKEA